ncbi:hypothetical protein MJO28_007649 [Puccinia striiformis f. sp. tritici]|uniref:Uncharacterized protein n=1 Tax=Puccinia striiformis f. sp. tritici TaxID=168172 RepID=A0ACC0EFT3_9BASI|nr:hypothetical protein MJO28_007649 [Puccinia striiformis f. sp. tritici]
MQQAKHRSRVLIGSWSPTASTVASSSINNLTGETPRNSQRPPSSRPIPPRASDPNAEPHLRTRTRPVPPQWRLSRKTRMRPLRKLIPVDFKGQLKLKAVTFYYPSNEPTPYDFESKSIASIPQTPDKPNLGDVSMYFLREISRSVEADELGSVGWLDPDWFQNQIYLVSGLTSTVPLPGTLHENIAIGVGSTRDWRTVSRLEVIRAAKFALLHEFISDLPKVYGTKLDSETDEQTSGNYLPSGQTGSSGVQSLSGGQKQRLGLAPAWIRYAPILILATSALDLTTQALTYGTIRQRRHNKTTICITHNLKLIGPKDYVYVMQSGRVVQSDYRYKLEAKPTSTSLFKQMARRSTSKFRKLLMIIALKVKFQSSRRPQMSDQTRKTITSSECNELEELANTAQVKFSVPQDGGLGSHRNSLPATRKRITFLDGFIHAPQTEGSVLAPQQSGLTPAFSSHQNAWQRSIRPSYLEEQALSRQRRPSLRSSFSAEELRKPSSQKFRTSGLSRYSIDKLKFNGFQHAGNKTSRAKTMSTIEQEDDEYQQFTASVMLQASKIAPSRRSQLNSQIDSNPGSAEKSTPERRKKWSAEELTNTANDGHQEEVSHLSNCRFCFERASGTMTPVLSVVWEDLSGKIANPPPGFLIKNLIYILVISIAYRI